MGSSSLVVCHETFRSRIYLIRSTDHLLVGIYIPLPRLPLVIRDCTFFP